MSADLIDIDDRPHIVEDLEAEVVSSADEFPMLQPTVHGSRNWATALWPVIGERVRLTVTRPKKKRSFDANAYYWAGVLEDILKGLRVLAADAGERCPFRNVDELHEALKYRFLGVEVITVPGGGELERPSTTTKLYPGPFARYVDSCISWAAHLGIHVEEPKHKRRA